MLRGMTVMLIDRLPSSHPVLAVAREADRLPRTLAAFRQGGHAVATWAIGERLHSASISPCDDVADNDEMQTWFGQTHGGCSNSLGQALIDLAGLAAELCCRHLNRGVSWNEMPWIEIEADLMTVARLPVSGLVTIPEDDLADRASEAMGVVRDHWPAIAVVADLLMQNGTVDEQDVRSCCARMRRIPR